ncbi:MAG: hypothetical protein AAF962_09080 [Actinomycetota bacterium]
MSHTATFEPTASVDDSHTGHDTAATGGTGRAMWAWTGLRLLLGWTFLWSFLDKFFGLGFATCRDAETAAIDAACDAAMINGGSPTYGYLGFATQESHTGFLFDWMAPSAPDAINLADVLFMAALLLGGLALLLGVAVRSAAVGGAALLLFMYLAGDVWPETNPFVSGHLIEATAFIGIAVVGAGPFALQRWVDRRVPLLSRIP